MEPDPNAPPEGGCLCGAVRFRVAGRLFLAAYCHCTSCRRASGSAFAANASVRRDGVSFTGAEHVREYESSPGKLRAFCSRCGSPLYSRVTADPDVVRLRLGSFDGDPGVRPRFHICVGEKAAWFDITDDLPQFAEVPRPPAEAEAEAEAEAGA
jgi:hypothetical protein